MALDNLRRRGAELNLPRLREAGVAFVHGDVRDPADLMALDPVDAVVECSAEPSAHAGSSGDTAYVVDSNLVGARNCLELARRDSAQFVFLSTSRVYPFEHSTRRRGARPTRASSSSPTRSSPGVGPAGVSEDFPLAGPRTLYGATKLAAELLATEYRAAFGLRTVDRPLRGARRPVADGQGRPGRFHPLGAESLLRSRTELYGIWRNGKTGS